MTHADVALHPERNYLFGPNGAGKTSFLEAVHLLGRGRSFRTRQTARLVQRGSEELRVGGLVSEAGLEHRLGLRFQAGQLEINVDGAAEAGIVELARALPVHVIDPQVHDLIEAGPSIRRRFVDAGVFHVEHGYLGAWRGYRRALAQRNSALKAASRLAELEVWTRSLATAAGAVHDARSRYVGRLAAHVAAIGERLLDGALTVEYQPGWRAGVELADALRDGLDRDRTLGYTQSGPHRADIAVDLGPGAVRDAASRGQQKLVAAALVLAQVVVFAEAAQQGGTVLVDDPAAELDAAALERLLAELHRLKAQLIVTGLSRDAIHPSAGYPVFHVEQGEINPVL